MSKEEYDVIPIVVRKRKGRKPYTYSGEITVVDMNKLMSIAQQKFGQPDVAAVATSTSQLADVQSKIKLTQLKAQLAAAEKEKLKAERELEDEQNKQAGKLPKSSIIYPTYDPGEGKIKLIQYELNPGDTKVIADVPLKTENKDKEDEVDRAIKLVKLVKEGKTSEGVDVKAYIDAHVAASEARLGAKIDAKFNELKSLILSRFPKEGATDRVSSKTGLTLEDVKTMKELGLIKPAGTEENVVSTLKELRDLGLIQIGGGFNKEYVNLQKSLRDSDRAFQLALYNITQRQIEHLEKLGIEKEKLALLRDFAARIGAAAARATEEAEEGEEKGEPKGEPSKVTPGKKEGAMEIIKCEVCGFDMVIPPEKQKPGEKWTCEKCNSLFTYAKEEQESKQK